PPPPVRTRHLTASAARRYWLSSSGDARTTTIMSSKRFLAPAAAGVLALNAAPVWSITAEQTEAGRADYQQHCAMCHGADLRLLPTAPLVGPEFVSRWRGRSTNELLAQLRATMPPEGAGALAEETYVNVIAYLLAQNGAAAGAEPFAATSTLIGTLLPGSAPAQAAPREAPAPEPTGVIVAGTVRDFVPLSDELLRNPPPGDWPMLRRDYDASSYSPLDEITPENAHRLQLAWVWPMRDGGTNQPSPLAYRGTIFLNNTGGI